MGCTNGKTSNPNKNPTNNQVKAQPLSTVNQNYPQNNNTNLNSNNVNSNVPQYQQLGYQSAVSNGNTSNINQPPPVNQSQINYQNQPVNQSGIKGSGVLSPKNNENMPSNNLGNSNLGYNFAIKNNQQSGIKSYQESGYKPMFQSGIKSNNQSQIRPSPSSSGFKPNQYELIDTTDDEIVNQQKSMNFDLGIKFNMQVQVQ